MRNPLCLCAANRLAQTLRAAPPQDAELLVWDTPRALTLDAWLEQQAEKGMLAGVLTSQNSDGNGKTNHIVDRTFIEDGKRWVIDYKTVHWNEAEVPGFLKAHAEKNYREQLERYAGLFMEEGLPVQIAIFYMLQGELVELDRNDLPVSRLA